MIELFGDALNGIVQRIVLESNYESFSLIVIRIRTKVGGDIVLEVSKFKQMELFLTFQVVTGC